MSCGTDHSFKSESDQESENEGEAEESEGSVDKPQSTSFPGMGIHHGSARDLPMSGLQRDEASREKLAVHNCLNQVKMHSCLSLESSMFGEIP